MCYTATCSYHIRPRARITDGLSVCCLRHAAYRRKCGSRMPGLLRQYGGLKRGARLASAGAGRQTVATAERRRGALHAPKSTTRVQAQPKAPPHSVLRLRLCNLRLSKKIQHSAERLCTKLFLGMQTPRGCSLLPSARSSRGWIRNAGLCAMSSRSFTHTLRAHAPFS